MTGQDAAVVEELRTIGGLLRLASHETIKQLIASELDDPKTIEVYRATDGVASQGEVARHAGVSQPTVSRLWQRWKTIGLAVDGESGRARALFDAAAYGVGSGAEAGKRTNDRDSAPKGKRGTGDGR